MKESLQFANMLRNLASQECYEEDTRHLNRQEKKIAKMELRNQRKAKTDRLNPVEEEEHYC